MNKVFEDDNITLILNTGKDVSSYTTFRVKYERPDGVVGEWASALHPSNNNYLRSLVTFPMDGVWKVQAYVSKIGSTLHGMWADIPVYQPLYLVTTAPPTTVAPTT